MDITICTTCENEDGEHYCVDCGGEMSAKECAEGKGLCYMCVFMLDK